MTMKCLHIFFFYESLHKKNDEIPLLSYMCVIYNMIIMIMLLYFINFIL